MTNIALNKQPSLFSAIAIGVGSTVGSGWLFASYYAAQYAGPIAILSWLIGAVLALTLSLLLAEIATMYQETGLLSRLLTISHNKDYGFIVAISNWFAMVSSTPSEAIATVQYLGHAFPIFDHWMFVRGDLTLKGIIVVYLIIGIYGALNYWGIKTLTRANNAITTIKMIVPAGIGILFMFAAFHPGNFTVYRGTVAPYGIGNAFTAIVTCGIFYAFYGFSMITVFAKELKNPKRNIPLALAGSVIICLVIYLILQVSFIGAMDPVTIATKGWHTLNFQSPLADLAIILGMNWLAMLLYVDAAMSPSGTGVVYIGSGTRMLNGMAEDGQMPKVFATINHKFFISRTSLVFTLAICAILVIFFNNWQKIMIVVTVFELLSCLAIPIAFSALRKNQPVKERLFRMPCGSLVSFAAYMVVSYLLTQCGFKAMLLSICLHFAFFLVYCIAYHKLNLTAMANALRSSWSMFGYLALMCGFAYMQDINILNQPQNIAIFVLGSIAFYYFMIGQKYFTRKVN
jgi:amino acid transporter